MQVQLVPVAAKESGNHKRLAIHMKADMCQKGSIQDRGDGLCVMRPPRRQSSKFGSFGQVHSFTRVSVAIQFTSQVLPPSSENACSNLAELGVMSDITNRTRMARPFRVSWL